MKILVETGLLNDFSLLFPSSRFVLGHFLQVDCFGNCAHFLRFAIKETSRRINSLPSGKAFHTQFPQTDLA